MIVQQFDHYALPSMSAESLAAAQVVEDAVLAADQEDITTHHVLHAGLYARTVLLPAGDILTGALIKIPTTVIVVGDVAVHTGDGIRHLSGYNVLPASAGRKQAYIAHSDTYITMIFPTLAKTIEEAEKEFTDDYERLMSRKGENIVLIGDIL